MISTGKQYYGALLRRSASFNLAQVDKKVENAKGLHEMSSAFLFGVRNENSRSVKTYLLEGIGTRIGVNNRFKLCHAKATAMAIMKGKKYDHSKNVNK